MQQHLRSRKEEESESEEEEAETHEAPTAAAACEAPPPNPREESQPHESSEKPTEPLEDAKPVTKEQSLPPSAPAAAVVPEPKVDRRTLILNVFRKRTVGQAFEEAVQRYKERLNAKTA